MNIKQYSWDKFRNITYILRMVPRTDNIALLTLHSKRDKYAPSESGGLAHYLKRGGMSDTDVPIKIIGNASR